MISIIYRFNDEEVPLEQVMNKTAYSLLRVRGKKIQDIGNSLKCPYPECGDKCHISAYVEDNGGNFGTKLFNACHQQFRNLVNDELPPYLKDTRFL